MFSLLTPAFIILIPAACAEGLTFAERASERLGRQRSREQTSCSVAMLLPTEKQLPVCSSPVPHPNLCPTSPFSLPDSAANAAAAPRSFPASLTSMPTMRVMQHPLLSRPSSPVAKAKSATTTASAAGSYDPSHDRRRILQFSHSCCSHSRAPTAEAAAPAAATATAFPEQRHNHQRVRRQSPVLNLFNMQSNTRCGGLFIQLLLIIAILLITGSKARRSGKGNKRNPEKILFLVLQLFCPVSTCLNYL